MRITSSRARRITLAAAALAASFPLGLAAAPAAQAAPNGCASGALCVYWDTFYRGSKYQFFNSNSSWGAYAIENDDSSWFNNGTSGLAVRVYEDRGYGGSSICFSRGDGDQIALAVDDRGSSNLWVSSC
jgi:hypothetical protein